MFLVFFWDWQRSGGSFIGFLLVRVNILRIDELKRIMYDGVERNINRKFTYNTETNILVIQVNEGSIC